MPRHDKGVDCPSCGGLMDSRAKGCRTCRHGGRGLSKDTAYARSLGISTRKLCALGGEKKLRSLDPDALAVLLAPMRYGNSRTVHRGGMAARGMESRVRGDVSQKYLIPPQVEFGVPAEALLSDEGVEALG